VDLRKAYESVDWDFLHLVLLQIGFDIPMTKWIMSCVIYPTFVVIINGKVSDLFKSGRGLR